MSEIAQLEREDPRKAGRRHRFGRHDRIVIDGVYYQCKKKVEDSHFLRLVVDGVLQKKLLIRTDTQINALIRAGKFRCDQDHYSEAANILRMRTPGSDDTDIFDLEDAELRTVAWKTEWVDRFIDAMIDFDAPWRPKRTLSDMSDWIEKNRERMDRWYLERFEERRRPGRRRQGEKRKEFDWPSPSSLRNWLIKYENAGCRMQAFRPEYHRCGNRNQLDPRAAEIIAKCVPKYAGSNAPLKRQIVEEVMGHIRRENAKLKEGDRISAGDTAIRRRIDRLNPLLVSLGREGPDKALRRHCPVGRGQRHYRPLQRIEIDDWEFDLFSLLQKSSVWLGLTREQRRLVPRIRCTVTMAIDVATRCIVGIFISPLAPSTAGSRIALRSTAIDKTPWAVACGCRSDWPMYGTVAFVVTDGGPAFQGEFEDAVRSLRGGRRRPNQDKRMRGYIESALAGLKSVCTYFAGRTFANIVERGDYKSEENASVVFEELRRVVVRYVVDVYHNKPHRGLEGQSPYQAWSKWNRKDGFGQAPNDRTIRQTFGFSRDYAIDPHGITVGRFSYQDEKLAALGIVMNGTKVRVCIDPSDLGVATVSVPARYRQRFADMAKDQGVKLKDSELEYLDVESVDDLAKGLTLEGEMAASRKLKALVRESAEKGNDIRYAAILDLVEIGEKARKAAGLPTFVPTQAEYEQFCRLLQQTTRSALSEVSHAEEPVDPDDDDVGEKVAQAVRTTSREAPSGKPASKRASRTRREEPGPAPGTRSHKPFGGSFNMDEEDEE